jgi:hypothetical protein
MVWWQCVLLGAGGGAVVEMLEVLRYLLAWQLARRTPGGQVRKSPPKMRTYVDVPAHVWLLGIRMPLGAGVAWLFSASGQISGPYAALTFGFAAPVVLAQMGRLRGNGQEVEEQARRELPPASDFSVPQPRVGHTEEVEQA